MKTLAERREGREGSVTAGLDLLALPLIGPLLKRRTARTWLQVPLFLGAVALVVHGLVGPQLAPRNLATLLGWVHWRGVLVLGLLLIGNLFCMACPFLLPRGLARRVARPPLAWPAALRNKWLSIALLVGVLFSYELFDLWGSPFLTAWLVLGYFLAAFVVDVLFRESSFCKWVCPIGQFNFAASTASPFEVTVRDAGTCGSCSTHDCIAGRPAGSASPADPGARGCETGLFLPRKVGNLDCTFCLDCIHACPHDNVAIAARLPGAEIWESGSRAGLGPVEERADLSAVAVVFTFGALLNAFGMVSPVYALEQWLADRLGTTHEAPVLALVFAAFLLVEPFVLLGLAAALARPALARREPLARIAVRFAWGFAPLGFGVWLAHYSFHLLTGLWTFVPVVQQAVVDACGHALLGAPAWGLGGFRAGSIFPVEAGFLSLGLLVSLGVLWQLALREAPARAARAFAPWAGVAGVLFASALWLMRQPMEMRGTFLGTG